ncbi:MAG: hypothetical protein LBO04_00495 [Spirochaetaceae bacterium]|jgi:hypothetical protein|nr:hypothetical protein [Spirochaetaceae bacterium]
MKTYELVPKLKFWNSHIYLKDYQSMEEVKAGLKRYFAFYNGRRYNASIEYRTPDEVYTSAFKDGQAEAGTLLE